MPTPRSSPSSCPGGPGSPAARPAPARPEGHRRGEAAHQTHVVVQRQPRDHHAVSMSTSRRTMASRFASRTRSGIITPFGSHVEPLVYCRISRRSGSVRGISMASARGGRDRAAWRDRHDRGIALHRPRRTRRAGRRSAGAWRHRGGCAPGSTATNSSNEPMRIGSGSTIEPTPASQHPRTAVIRARLVGPRMATWSPGAMPARLQRGPHRTGLVVHLAPRHPHPIAARVSTMNRRGGPRRPESAACSSREVTGAEGASVGEAIAS